MLTDVGELYNDLIRGIDQDELAAKARAILRRVRMLPVIDERRRLVGVVYRRSVIGAVGTRSVLLVRNIMEPARVVAYPDEEIEHAVKRMLKIDEWYAPVVRSPTDYTYLGLFGLEHVMEEYLKRGSRKLNTPLEEIMTRDVETVRYDEPVTKVWRKMLEYNYAGIPVVDEKGRLVGLVTMLDLLMSRAPNLHKVLARIQVAYAPEIVNIMNKNVVYARPFTTVGEAAHYMLKLEIGRLPIVDDRLILVGMVDREDIVRYLVGLG